MSSLNVRYVEKKLDANAALQHDVFVSSIFLQENRFKPAHVSGLFFA